MRILVTGGSGFIGTHLLNRLSQENVTINLDIRNGNLGETQIRGDVRDRQTVRDAIKGCETVFHLAAVTGFLGKGHFETNFEGSGIVFEEAERAGAKVIYASSASVYGNSKPPHSESSLCVPSSDYGFSKLGAEKLAPKGAFIARLFNVYGPGGKSVINKFCQFARKGRALPLTSPSMSRDYVHVNDIVDALLLGLETGGVFNIGTGIETPNSALIETIQRFTGNIKIEPIGERRGEIKTSFASPEKIFSEGWRPKVDLINGIKEAIGSRVK